MLCCDAIVVVHELGRELAAGRTPVRRKIKRDQFLVRQSNVVGMNNAAIVPLHEVAFEKFGDRVRAGYWGRLGRVCGTSACDSRVMSSVGLAARCGLFDPG